jgi:hypothetical protein
MSKRMPSVQTYINDEKAAQIINAGETWYVHIGSGKKVHLVQFVRFTPKITILKTPGKLHSTVPHKHDQITPIERVGV